PQPSAFARLLGSKEWIEDAFGVADAGPIVHKCHLNRVARALCGDADSSVISGLLDGVVRVIQDIQEYLLELLRVPQRFSDTFVELLDHLDSVAGKIVATQANRLLQDRVYLYRFFLCWPLASEPQQVLYDFLCSLRLLQDDLQILFRRS